MAQVEASWYAADGRPCEREQAVSILLRHLDDRGEVIESMWGEVVDGVPQLDLVARAPSPPADRPRAEVTPPPPPPPAPPPPPPPPPPAPPPPEATPMVSTEARLVIGVPRGWFMKESVTLVSPDGSGNVIFSSEPLDPSLDSSQYAMIQGELLRKEFPAYEEHEFVAASMLGTRQGYRRRFSWTPPDGVRVNQTQLYCVIDGRGYTATATTPRSSFAELEAVLGSVRLRVR